MPQPTENRMMPKNAFEILLQSSKERKRPKKFIAQVLMISFKQIILLSNPCKLINQLLLFVGDTKLRGDQIVRNKLLDLLEEMKVGWALDVVDTIGERFVKQLTSTLWYLDGHHQKFLSRSIHLPEKLRDLMIGSEKN